jgi:hypothetical protein
MTGRPTGSGQFTKRLERLTGRQQTPCKRGRKKKGQTDGREKGVALCDLCTFAFLGASRGGSMKAEDCGQKLGIVITILLILLMTLIGARNFGLIFGGIAAIGVILFINYARSTKLKFINPGLTYGVLIVLLILILLFMNCMR